MIAAIAKQLTDGLQDAVNVGGKEPQIIKKFVDGAQMIQTSSHFKVESIFVHQKPYAYFSTPTHICGKKRTELGDILFIVKRLRQGATYDHRFTFAQAKKLSKGVASIEVHQFRFYQDIASISFRFGNRVHKTSGITPCTWTALSTSRWFGHYLLLNSPFSLAVRINLVDTQFPAGCNSFDFQLAFPRTVLWPCAFLGLLPYEQFLISFLQSHGLGVHVSRKTENFLELIMKHVGWNFDPPEETEGYFKENEKGGLGIIRITITDEE
jgi:hypothetical protein